MCKINLHTAVFSTVLVLFSFVKMPEQISDFWHGGFSLSILLLLLPLMIWERYRLNIHLLAELIGGAVAGLLLTIIEISLLTILW